MSLLRHRVSSAAIVQRGLIVGVFCCMASASCALDFRFVHEGFSEGAFVRGVFSGQDLDNNGQLSSFRNEITAFAATFSGNSVVPAFSAEIDDLFGLVYDLGAGQVIGDGITIDVEGIGVNSPGFTYVTGEGPDQFPGGRVADNGVPVSDFSTQNAIVTAVVPEPSAVTTALLGVVVGTVRRQRRQQRFAG